MSAMKRYLEDNIGSFTDEELVGMGYDPYDVALMKIAFGEEKEDENETYYQENA